MIRHTLLVCTSVPVFIVCTVVDLPAPRTLEALVFMCVFSTEIHSIVMNLITITIIHTKEVRLHLALRVKRSFRPVCPGF